MEVFLDGRWKQNGIGVETKMIRLHEPADQSMDILEFDPIDKLASKLAKLSLYSNSICYYIDFATSTAESGTTENQTL